MNDPNWLSLPLSLIGVVLALLITGDTLNIMSLIGVILLMGVVANRGTPRCAARYTRTRTARTLTTRSSMNRSSALSKSRQLAIGGERRSDV